MWKLSCCGDISSVVDKNVEEEIRTLQEKGIERCKPPEISPIPKSRALVSINVYHLSSKNSSLRKVGFGIFHVGVVIYGIEWSYGESLVKNQVGTGLFSCTPGSAGTLFRSLMLGETTLSPVQVDTILHRLENEWPSKDYHILHHNCNHFAQCLCFHLSTVKALRVPRWCNRAARAADKFIPKKVATSIQHKVEGRAVPKASESSLLSATLSSDQAKITPHLPPSVIPARWYDHPTLVKSHYVKENVVPTFSRRNSAQGASENRIWSPKGGDIASRHRRRDRRGNSKALPDNISGKSETEMQVVDSRVNCSRKENLEMCNMVSIDEEEIIIEQSERSPVHSNIRDSSYICRVLVERRHVSPCESEGSIPKKKNASPSVQNFPFLKGKEGRVTFRKSFWFKNYYRCYTKYLYFRPTIRRKRSHRKCKKLRFLLFLLRNYHQGLLLEKR